MLGLCDGLAEAMGCGGKKEPSPAAAYHVAAAAEEEEDVEDADEEAGGPCGHDRCAVRREWSRVFERLDEADGIQDGRIDRRALVKWVSALDLQKTIEFEASLNIDPVGLERLVSRADHNKDGFVDREEFLELVANRDAELSRRQQSLLWQYLRVAAYAERYSCCPPPLFVPSVTALQVAVYLYHVAHFLTLHPDSAVTWKGPEPICSTLIYDPGRRREAWRFLSYCLVHAGAQHVLFNMIMQLFVGLPLETSHGFFRVAMVYISGVLAGSLGSSTLDPGVFLAGASGGVYALIAAHLATLLLNWREDIVIMRQRFRSGRAPSAKHGHVVRTMRLVIVVLYIALDTGLAVVHRRRAAAAGRPPVSTSYAAHACGAAAGFLVGIVALKNRKVEHWERWLKALCVLVFAAAMAAAVVWNLAGDEVVRAASGDPGAAYFPVPAHLGGWDAHKDGSCHPYI